MDIPKLHIDEYPIRGFIHSDTFKSVLDDLYDTMGLDSKKNNFKRMDIFISNLVCNIPFSISTRTMIQSGLDDINAPMIGTRILYKSNMIKDYHIVKANIPAKAYIRVEQLIDGNEESTLKVEASKLTIKVEYNSISSPNEFKVKTKSFNYNIDLIKKLVDTRISEDIVS